MDTLEPRGEHDGKPAGVSGITVSVVSVDEASSFVHHSHTKHVFYLFVIHVFIINTYQVKGNGPYYYCRSSALQGHLKVNKYQKK